ncbi:hypothetical protein ACHAXN_001019 [Cyclotella atomus]
MAEKGRKAHKTTDGSAAKSGKLPKKTNNVHDSPVRPVGSKRCQQQSPQLSPAKANHITNINATGDELDVSLTPLSWKKNSICNTGQEEPHPVPSLLNHWGQGVEGGDDLQRGQAVHSTGSSTMFSTSRMSSRWSTLTSSRKNCASDSVEMQRFVSQSSTMAAATST